ncbi:MAG: aminomethyl-transferring glycine dehydrogenase subunit GcvPA [Desulfobacteraceae bacterium]|nr:aminomethyl-transferring glycine dehydrogenase subunit GcvPA [Desulfobacteraceae bacterium]
MRYLPHTDEEISEMLGVVGAESLDDLFSTVPTNCCCRLPIDLPEALSEWDLNRHMDELSGNMAVSPDYKVFMGAGSYDHFIPASNTYVRSRSEFVTSYTPYQPEMSQGTLQGIYEYQTLAARLMGMDVATASHYDGATALTEALLMAIRKTRKQKVAVSRLVHPLHREVIKTYFGPTGFEIIELPAGPDGRTDLSAIDGLDDIAAVAIQSPNFFGCIEDLKIAAEKAGAQKALFITSFTEAIAYGLLKSPGSLGAEIVAGDGQSLGLPRSFGGPGLGMLGSKSKYVRSLPGRLVGRATDVNGKDGFVLTLSTREQHIRREKATSNICSNNSLCALSAAIYMATLGGSGLRRLAEMNHQKAEYLKNELKKAGMTIPFSAKTFNEFVVKFPDGFKSSYDRLLEKKIVAGLPLASYYPELADHYLLCATETASREDMDMLVREVTV